VFIFNPRSLIEPTGRFTTRIPKPVPPANYIRPFKVPFSLDSALLPRTKAILFVAAFMIGLKIGQLIRKPVRDFFGNLLDPSQPTNPDSVPSWQQQDPLPAAFDLTQTGQMGTEGATLQATMYWDKSEAEDDGCGAIETFGPNVKAKVTIDGTGGGLRWSRGPLTENSCGWKSWVLQVLTSMPASGSTDDPLTRRSQVSQSTKAMRGFRALRSRSIGFRLAIHFLICQGRLGIQSLNPNHCQR